MINNSISQEKFQKYFMELLDGSGKNKEKEDGDKREIEERNNGRGNRGMNINTKEEKSSRTG